MRKKIWYRSLLLLALLLVLFISLSFDTIKRLYTTIHLFDEEVITENFRNMDMHYPVSRLEAAALAQPFEKNIAFELPDSFPFNGKNINTHEFLAFNQMEGLMILQHDTIIFEDYRLGLRADDTHISWSVAKSIVSALLGIAYDDGLFSLDEAITSYLPQFKNTGYDGVKIKDILQMSSGVRFNEDYGDFYSDINRFGRAFAMGTSLEKFAKSLENEKEPGSYCRYVSIDTQVLGQLLQKLTDMSLTEYLRIKLWEPMGMEDEGEWITDNTGMEVALGGLNMTLRDYAKFGQLYLDEGKWKGKQLVSREWVRLSTTPDAKHLKPGKQAYSNNIQGYGFQWWIPEIDEGDFYATGIHDQYIYVHPTADVVIAMLSSNPHFNEREAWGKRPHIYLFKEIIRSLVEEKI